jgi:hypothetical protein
MQKPENAGPQYWASIDWLHDQIQTTDKQDRHNMDRRFRTGTAHLAGWIAKHHGGTHVI